MYNKLILTWCREGRYFPFAQCGNNLILGLAITEITEIEKKTVKEIKRDFTRKGTISRG
jgi:hypothetical protein